MWQLSARKNKGKAVGWYARNGGRTVPVPKVQYNHFDAIFCTQTQVKPLCLSFDNVSRPFENLQRNTPPTHTTHS
jgi:hypothetical protein